MVLAIKSDKANTNLKSACRTGRIPHMKVYLLILHTDFLLPFLKHQEEHRNSLVMG